MPSVTFTAGSTLTAAQMNQIGQDSDWITVGSFTNSWGAGSRAPQYRKVGNRVQLRGLLTSGTAGATAFNLPSGYRPPQNHLIAAVNVAGSATSVTVDTSGNVQPNTSSGWSLDTISFYVD